MSIRYSHALLVTLSLMAAPAFAQETPQPAPTDETEPQPATPEAAPATSPAGTAPDETPAAAGDTSTPAPAAPAPSSSGTTAQAAEEALGSYYLKTEHADWTLRCIRTDQPQDPCELYQLLNDAEGNSVAEITLIPLTNGDVAAGATLVAPLETDLIDGLGFGIDGAAPRGYPFSFCAPVGCIARMGFTAEELSAMKRGSKATVTLRPFGSDPDKPVELPLSLAGFTAGFDELTAYMKASASAAEGAAQPAGEAPSTTQTPPAN